MVLQQEEQKLILVTGAEPGGTNEYWKVNNIYDLAGNVSEWTQEKYSTGFIWAIRGGNYNYNGFGIPAANRYDGSESSTTTRDGFRVGFYV